ncbi:MAG: 23S rRNA (adenine(2503)-C(2))-methyltransferase RlmN [bacterium]
MTTLRSLKFTELQALVAELGWEPYRARQVWRWLWTRGATDIAEMTDLKLDRRTALAERLTLGAPELRQRQDDPDGTGKFTFALNDGAVVESVHIPDGDRRTICVSSQAGCPLGCRFCATGALGFRRDLAWHEIAGQVVDVIRLVGARPTNIVFMGMGEPFLNYDAAIEAVRVINSPDAVAIGARHITLSTAGIPDRIRQFATLPLQVKLAVSLNAAEPELRAELMPVSRRHPLPEVIDAVRHYVDVTGRRVTFEYVLLAGVNDRPTDASALAALLRGIPCKLNLIPFNAYTGSEFTAPSEKSLSGFAERLYPHLPAVTIRRSKGPRIAAACGQLAARPVA